MGWARRRRRVQSKDLRWKDCHWSKLWRAAANQGYTAMGKMYRSEPGEKAREEMTYPTSPPCFCGRERERKHTLPHGNCSPASAIRRIKNFIVENREVEGKT